MFAYPVWVLQSIRTLGQRFFLQFGLYVLFHLLLTHI